MVAHGIHQQAAPPVPHMKIRSGLKIRTRWGRLRSAFEQVETHDELDRLRQAVGRLEARQLIPPKPGLAGQEFSVYSQGGEDGIIQFLIHNVAVPRRMVTTSSGVSAGLASIISATTPLTCGAAKLVPCDVV